LVGLNIGYDVVEPRLWLTPLIGVLGFTRPLNIVKVTLELLVVCWSPFASFAHMVYNPVMNDFPLKSRSIEAGEAFLWLGTDEDLLKYSKWTGLDVWRMDRNGDRIAWLMPPCERKDLPRFKYYSDRSGYIVISPVRLNR
jgi:hypothetical protein